MYMNLEVLLTVWKEQPIVLEKNQGSSLLLEYKI